MAKKGALNHYSDHYIIIAVLPDLQTVQATCSEKPLQPRCRIREHVCACSTQTSAVAVPYCYTLAESMS